MTAIVKAAQPSAATAAGLEAVRATVSAIIADIRERGEPDEVGAAVIAMLRMPGLCGADIDLSAGMVAP